MLVFVDVLEVSGERRTILRAAQSSGVTRVCVAKAKKDDKDFVMTFFFCSFPLFPIICINQALAGRERLLFYLAAFA